MAKKKRTVEAPESSADEMPDCNHVVTYTEGNGEEITAKFPSEDHSLVLRDRLRAHGIHHTYEGPDAE